MNRSMYVLVAALLALGVPGTESRADSVFFDQPLDAGFNVGSGIPNDHFVGARSSIGPEIEIGLGALVRFGFTGNIAPTASSNPDVAGEFVNLPPGLSPVNQNSPPTLAAWNFNYSFYSAAGLAGDTAFLTITGLDGVAHVFSSGVLPGGAGTFAQDSTNLGFFGLPLSSYNPNQEGTYTISATLFGPENALLLTTTAEYDVAPEPSTMVMGLMSSVLAGGYFWRQRARHRTA
jgi:PEP-CTERM motif